MMMVAPFVSVGMQQWCSSDKINCTFMFATPQSLSAWLCLLYLTTENPLRFSWLLRVIRATASRNARASMWKLDIPAYRSYQQCTEHHEPQPHQNMTQIRPVQSKLWHLMWGFWCNLYVKPYQTLRNVNMTFHSCGGFFACLWKIVFWS